MWKLGERCYHACKMLSDSVAVTFTQHFNRIAIKGKGEARLPAVN